MSLAVVGAIVGEFVAATRGGLPDWTQRYGVRAQP